MKTYTKEIRKDVIGYEGYYMVSNLGNIKSLDRVVIGRSGSSYLRKGSILKPKKNKDGYYNVTLSKQNTIKHYLLSRLVCSSFIDNIENKPQVNHIDGDRANNNVDNLERVTSSENKNHGYRVGITRKFFSGDHWLSKSISIISDKGEMIKTFKSVTDAAVYIGCSKSHASLVAQGKKSLSDGNKLVFN